MNTRPFHALFFVALFALLAGCAGEAKLPQLGEESSPEERRVLVTFVDQTIAREVAGNPMDGYRARGSYLNSGWSQRVARQLADRHALQLVAQWPVTELGVSCVVYEVPPSLPLDAVIATLQKDSTVGSVQRMQSFKVMGEPAASVSPPVPAAVAGPGYSDPYLSLQTSFKSLDIAAWHKKATGHGVRIALVDTGVDLDHPDLRGQIHHFENMAPVAAGRNEADKHGTAVAGVLSALPDNGIGIAGIAPQAEILAFRACWPEQPSALSARCNSFTLALALNQAIRMDSRIINLSLSGPEDPLLRTLVEKALSKGIIVIAAVPAKGDAGGFPANVPGVIAVGRGGEDNACEIVAPGRDILTTVPSDAYDFMTGSSFAAPHVAGLAALMLELHPEWNAGDIRAQLQDPAGPMGAFHASLIN